MRHLLFAALLFVASPVRAEDAKQTSHHIDEGEEAVELRFAWQTRSGGADEVRFDLAADEVAADKSVKRKLQLIDLNEAMARAARRSAKGRKAVKLTAKATKNGVQLGASGPPKAARAALKEAQAAMADARSSWLRDHQVFEIRPGVLSYDHARVAADRAAAIAPLAAALRAGTTSDRDFVERALSFSQSIPYQRGKRGQDTGFQRPLALVARNKGDCDGKSALFLAIVRAELPELPLAMIYVPQHALVGVGLPPQSGDRSFKSGGTTYVYAEPVGPGAFPLGQTAPENKRGGKMGMVRPVPR